MFSFEKLKPSLYSGFQTTSVQKKTKSVGTIHEFPLHSFVALVVQKSLETRIMSWS